MYKLWKYLFTQIYEINIRNDVYDTALRTNHPWTTRICIYDTRCHLPSRISDSHGRLICTPLPSAFDTCVRNTRLSSWDAICVCSPQSARHDCITVCFLYFFVPCNSLLLIPPPITLAREKTSGLCYWRWMRMLVWAKGVVWAKKLFGQNRKQGVIGAALSNRTQCWNKSKASTALERCISSHLRKKDNSVRSRVLIRIVLHCWVLREDIR
jgi:hypothetical protein